MGSKNKRERERVLKREREMPKGGRKKGKSRQQQPEGEEPGER